MTSQRDHKINLPPRKLFHDLLKSTHDGWLQELEIFNEHYYLRILAIIPVPLLVHIGLPRQIVWPSEAFKQLVDASLEIFKYFILLGLAPVIFVRTHRLHIVSRYQFNHRHHRLLVARDPSAGHISRLPD